MFTLPANRIKLAEKCEVITLITFHCLCDRETKLYTEQLVEMESVGLSPRPGIAGIEFRGKTFMISLKCKRVSVITRVRRPAGTGLVRRHALRVTCYAQAAPSDGGRSLEVRWGGGTQKWNHILTLKNFTARSRYVMLWVVPRVVAAASRCCLNDDFMSTFKILRFFAG